MTWFYILPLSSGVPVIFKKEELLNQIPTSLQSDPREGLYKPEMALELLQSAVRRTATAKSSKNLRKKAQAGAAKSASRVEVDKKRHSQWANGPKCGWKSHHQMSLRSFEGTRFGMALGAEQ